MAREEWRAVLRFSAGPVSRSKIRRHYARYRRERGIPDRCDNDACVFHTAELLWNGQRLPLILDHRDGVRNDNSPDKLRYLCPNCDSQLHTRGGKNKGRVTYSGPGGYAIKRHDGKRDYTLVAEAGTYVLRGDDAVLHRGALGKDS